MIYIKNITIENFQGIAQKTQFDFQDQRNLFTIKGSNGVGKSTILDAIYFALFGESDRVDKLVELINVQWPDKDAFEIFVFQIFGRKNLSVSFIFSFPDLSDRV